MIESVLILWCTAFGLGQWFRVQGFGTKLFLGTALVPMILLIGSDVLGFGLRATAVGILILAGAGATQSAYRCRADLGNAPLALLGSLISPAFVVPAIVIVAAFLQGGATFLPYLWDEFTTWLIWPKFQFLIDYAWRDDMAVSVPGYPPGWPLLLVFPQLFAERFNEVRSTAASIVVAAGFLGLFFDTVLALATKVSGPVGMAGRLWLLGLLLLLVLLPAPHEIIPSDVLMEIAPTKLLIEMPQIAFGAAVFLFLLRLGVVDDRGYAGLVFGGGLTLGSAFLIKSAGIILVPFFLLALLWISLARHGSSQPPHISLRASRGLIIRDLAMGLGPFLGLFFLWKVLGPESVTCHGNLAIFANNLLSITSTQAVPFSKFAARSADFLSGFVLVPSMILLFFFAAGSAFRHFRAVVMVVTGWGVIYVTVLYLAYLGCFKAVEQEILISLARYLSVPLVTMILIGGAVLLTGLFAARGRIRDGIHKIPRPVRIGLSGLVALGGVSLALVDSTDRIDFASNRFSKPNTSRQYANGMQTARKILQLIERLGLERPTVKAIVQGGFGLEVVALRYISVPERRGGNLFAFTIAPGYAWTEIDGHPYAAKADREMILKYIKKADIVWPYRLHPASGWAINRVVRDPRCLNNIWAQILVKRQEQPGKPTQFICYFNDFIAK